MTFFTTLIMYVAVGIFHIPTVPTRDSKKNETCQHFGCKIQLQVVPIILNLYLRIIAGLLLYQFWLKLSKTFIEYCYFYTYINGHHFKQ